MFGGKDLRLEEWRPCLVINQLGTVRCSAYLPDQKEIGDFPIYVNNKHSNYKS